ncbi:uncharacterized protein LOC124439841 isoform X2 [Xenia sp. Carnegie-2017]|uniref:uncharacterized protein LOC124439841 isoform X2 n=2 Tax=Xenia sp. Carnegie-2017 TaxID=2897299 RepID=UPI001F043228|nr:uncharacterized protein LOC124439841 isoform X2 [Xenia sp. Carnegie-2017]
MLVFRCSNMESPKCLVCPECSERYNDTKKRRLIDTCGHPRCYSCLMKDNPCPVCAKLPHGRQRARTLSREKIHEEIPQYHRLLSDTSVNTFTGMFRKDSYLRTLYSYDPNSKGYNMEEKMRKYRSLEILNDRARAGSFSSDVSSEAYISTVNCSTPDQRSLCSSIDELNEDNTKSSSDSTPHSAGDSVKRPSCPKTWPSCPDLTHYENIWQMRQSTIERRKRPSSLYQMKYSSCNSPRSSGVYSPRSSGYWSELEQLSESETLSPSPSPLSQDTDKDDISITEKSQESEINESDINLKGAWQITRGVLQKWRFQSNRPQSECLTNNRNCSKPIQRINSVNIEQHTKKVSENNTARKAFMTDV